MRPPAGRGRVRSIQVREFAGASDRRRTSGFSPCSGVGCSTRNSGLCHLGRTTRYSRTEHFRLAALHDRQVPSAKSRWNPPVLPDRPGLTIGPSNVCDDATSPGTCAKSMVPCAVLSVPGGKVSGSKIFTARRHAGSKNFDAHRHPLTSRHEGFPGGKIGGALGGLAVPARKSPAEGILPCAMPEAAPCRRFTPRQDKLPGFHA